ncbi:hypothetical protein [Vibrio harveyi]|uniref:hypothetical protein n=1 Tax=Vibrio harveyi TaxID=669 RepID=UPI003CED6C03
MSTIDPNRILVIINAHLKMGNDMGIEFYGACCPICSQPILGKLEPNSVGAFQFDACPSCGFIDFETFEKRGFSDISKEDRASTWAAIVAHTGKDSFEALKAYTQSLNPEADMCTVFDYSDERFTSEYLLSCQVSPEEINSALLLL